MSQLFPRWANKLPLYAALAASLSGALSVAGVWYYFSPRYLEVGYMPRQPVPYSHALHVGELGLDCRYCHASVEISSVANIPPTQVCWNCHSVIRRESELLAPIRESMESGKPVRWVRVHNLPDYAYFHHAVHVRAGVGCVSCHGRIDQAQEVAQVAPLSMGWCLDCHRRPEPNLRPPDQVTNMAWVPPRDDPDLGARLRRQRGIDPPVDCSGCHR